MSSLEISRVGTTDSEGSPLTSRLQARPKEHLRIYFIGARAVLHLSFFFTLLALLAIFPVLLQQGLINVTN